jgi:protein TIF31
MIITSTPGHLFGFPFSRSALQNEKETYAIYRAQLGDDHDKTREASECLKHLTQQESIL